MRVMECRGYDAVCVCVGFCARLRSRTNAKQTHGGTSVRIQMVYVGLINHSQIFHCERRAAVWSEILAGDQFVSN